MPHRSPRWIWTGRIVALVIVVGLVAYLIAVGADKADKVASSIGAVVAVLALIAPYLLPMAEDAPGGPMVIRGATVRGGLTQRRRQGAAGSGQYIDGVWVGGDLNQIDGDPGTP